jgi:hypothetical protein
MLLQITSQYFLTHVSLTLHIIQTVKLSLYICTFQIPRSTYTRYINFLPVLWQ